MMRPRALQIDEEEVEATMQEDNADIPGVSIAFGSGGRIATKELGFTDKSKTSRVDSTTVFGAASLSKPVFAYLVLKLIALNQSGEEKLGLGQFHLPEGLAKFDLDTPLYKILPELSQCSDKAEAEKLTARMVLSHQTGISHSQPEDSLPDFLAEPGTEYEYGGLPYFYLQVAINRITHSSLQELAQKHIFDSIGMHHSTFLRPALAGDEQALSQKFPADINKFPAIAANSLRTTASDYMRFIMHWLNDDKLSFAFQSEISMTQDRWASNMGLSAEVLNGLASGLGWALQKNSRGDVVRAFHWADMNTWRADVAINLEDRTAIVYLANSQNGHVLAHQIISPNVELEHGLKYISEKLGFAVKAEQDWKASERRRFEKIGRYLESRTSLTVSDQDMVASAFGQSSNTARERAKTTTARLMSTTLTRRSTHPPAEQPVSADSEKKRSTKTKEKKAASQPAATEDTEKRKYQSPRPHGFSTKLTRDPHQR